MDESTTSRKHKRFTPASLLTTTLRPCVAIKAEAETPAADSGVLFGLPASPGFHSSRLPSQSVLPPATPAKPAVNKPHRKRRVPLSDDDSDFHSPRCDADDTTTCTPKTGEPRLRWSCRETEAIYQLEEAVDKFWADCNAFRLQEHEGLLPKPTLTQKARVLAERLGVSNKKAAFVSKYKLYMKNELPRPRADTVELPQHYTAAVASAAEVLLANQLAADAEGTVAGTGEQGPAQAPASVFVNKRLMPGTRVDQQHSKHKLEHQGTLDSARKQKLAAHRMQRANIAKLHGSHELGVWYEVTQDVCAWGTKKCFICGKNRQLVGGCLYALQVCDIKYYYAGEQVETRNICCKYMCKGCANTL